MGTNYYHCTNVCKECGSISKAHIGKQSFGWEFMFETGVGQDGYVYAQSWNDWKSLLLVEGTVVDEYGDVVPVENFIAMVEETHGRMNHYDYCERNALEHIHDGWTFKDSDGWAFVKGEFS